MTLRLTQEEYDALMRKSKAMQPRGYSPAWPAADRGASSPVAKGLPRGRRSAAERMNRTERAYSEMLSAGGLEWVYEGLSFRLDDGTWYRPDFLVFGDGGLEVHEVKGAHIWEDSIIKFKWARQRFPMLRWHLLQKANGEWKEIG